MKEENKVDEQEFSIVVKEVLERVIKIKASDIESAREKVQNKYFNEEIVLDSSDYVETEFNEMK